MKAVFKQVFKIYKYLLGVSLIFLILSFIYTVIDERYWPTNFPIIDVGIIDVGIILGILTAYILLLSLCFWGIASILILFYHKIIKR